MDDRIQHHLPYEIDALVDAYNVLAVLAIKASGFNKDERRILTNALIESFCVHARNLYEFFDKQANEPSSNMPKYTNSKYMFPRSRYKALRGELNMQVMHLIYGGRSTNPSDKIGDAMRFQMLDQLRNELENFRKHLTDPTWSKYIPSIPTTLTVSKVNAATNYISFSSSDPTTNTRSTEYWVSTDKPT
jgi:hypothetical protein